MAKHKPDNNIAEVLSGGYDVTLLNLYHTTMQNSVFLTKRGGHLCLF